MRLDEREIILSERRIKLIITALDYRITDVHNVNVVEELQNDKSALLKEYEQIRNQFNYELNKNKINDPLNYMYNLGGDIK